MPETKLKPCPFCGRVAATRTVVIREDMSGFSDCVRFEVYCPACHVGQHSSIESNDSFGEAEVAMQKAIEFWNRRADNSEVR